MALTADSRGYPYSLWRGLIMTSKRLWRLGWIGLLLAPMTRPLPAKEKEELSASLDPPAPAEDRVGFPTDYAKMFEVRAGLTFQLSVHTVIEKAEEAVGLPPPHRRRH